MTSSNESLGSVQTGGWSCASLEKGIQECAKVAGLNLEGVDAQKVVFGLGLANHVD